MIEQALFGDAGGAGGPRCLARSPGFRDEWVAAAGRLAALGRPALAGSGESGLFVQPFGGDHVAVVRTGPAAHLLIVPRGVYHAAECDPFHVAAQVPPPWDARGELPALAWTAGPPAPRTVAALRQILDTDEEGHSAKLLGGAQALLDGGRVLLERAAPDTRVVRELWALLPTVSRAELWPATHCADPEPFHLAAVPPGAAIDPARYLTEEKLGDYPEGRYEFALQAAVESGDEKELHRLLHRRTRAQTLRLALGLVAVVLAVLLVPAAFHLAGNAPAATKPATTAAISP